MENSKHHRNKKKQYRKQALNNKKANDLSTIKVSLQNNLKGFLVTCNQKEYQCLQESYNILNEASERLYPDQKLQELPPDPNDIEACIQKEITAERKHHRKFIQVKTKCKNLLFIRIQDDSIDPEKISQYIWQNLEQNPKPNSRYIQRIIPVVSTCKAENILECFQQVFEQKASKKVCSFSVQCRIRNNSSFKEKILQEQIVQIIRDRRPNWYVGLDRPDQLIQINLVCKAACLSILPDYVRYSKYNLMEFVKKKSSSSDFQEDRELSKKATSEKLEQQSKTMK